MGTPAARRRPDQTRASAGDAIVGAADAVGGLGGAVDQLDLLLAHALGHVLVLGDRVLVQANALLGHPALVDHDLFLVKHDLVLVLGPVGAGGDRVAIG